MKSAKRRRPLARRIGPVPDGTDLAAVAAGATYVGSPEHKDTPSFAGRPRPRADATKCDRRYADRQADLTSQLREAIRAGQVGAEWCGGFPRYVWARVDGRVHEARLVNEGQRWYKAYALDPDDSCPDGL